MLGRFVKGALLTGAFALVPCSGTAFAQPPPSSVAAPAPAPVAATPPAPAAAPPPAPAAATPRAPAHGAVVVALSDEAGPAARALAHEVYREPLLRPSIDEATARVLTGDAATATPEAAGSSVSSPRSPAARLDRGLGHRHHDSASPRLSASLRADLVVAVSLDGGHAMAKVLHAGTASYERVELGAGVEIAADGARSFSGRRRLHAARPAARASAAEPAARGREALAKVPEYAKPVHKAPPTEQGPVWKSPWFWAAIGGVAAVGITVFVLSKTTSTTHSIHLDGSVDP